MAGFQMLRNYKFFNKMLMPAINCKIPNQKNFSNCIYYNIGRCKQYKIAKITTFPFFINAKKYSTQKSTSFSLENENIINYTNNILNEYEAIKSNPKKSKRLTQLRTIVHLIEEINDLKIYLNDINELIKEYSTDKEMKTLALADLETAQNNYDEIEQQIINEIVYLESSDLNITDVELEVSAGAGGLEAMHFCQEIYNMYQNYAVYKGWEFISYNNEATDEGGFRSSKATVRGDNVFAFLKYEGGVHRVQRIPATEKSGRMHTSTISVAIMPQPKEADIEIKDTDLKITSIKASGPGGQHVNTTNSAVRIVHIPTGIAVESQAQRSQRLNKADALQKLRNILFQNYIDEETQKYRSQRKLQVGNKNRNEKIRTYNFQQDRLTDHRIGFTCHNLDSILLGQEALDNVIQKIMEEAHKEHILAVISTL